MRKPINHLLLKFTESFGVSGHVSIKITLSHDDFRVTGRLNSLSLKTDLRVAQILRQHPKPAVVFSCRSKTLGNEVGRNQLISANPLGHDISGV